MLFFKTLNTVLISSLFLLTACSEQQQQTKKRELPPLQVNTISVSKEAVPIWTQYTGMTKASSEQEVRARVSGILEKTYFKDGEFVHKGQKLFQIQQDEYIATLNAAKAKKQQNEASLALAIADVNRYKPLVDEGLAPRATLEQFEAQQAGLIAAIAGDVAQIKKAELELSYTTITSPISGHVSARLIDIGNLVGQGESTLLTTIVGIDPLYAYFSPSQDDVRLFQKYRNKEKPDAFIALNGKMGEIRLNGFIDFANNKVDPLTSTISMRATLDNKDGKILPGTFVYVNVFINDKYKFIMIPPEVIFTDQLGKYVYKVDENMSASRVDITTSYSTKYYVNVESGLQDGDKLIVSSLVKLKEGRKVIAKDVTDAQGIQAILKNNKLIPKAK